MPNFSIITKQTCRTGRATILKHWTMTTRQRIRANVTSKTKQKHCKPGVKQSCHIVFRDKKIFWPQNISLCTDIVSAQLFLCCDRCCECPALTLSRQMLRVPSSPFVATDVVSAQPSLCRDRCCECPALTLSRQMLGVLISHFVATDVASAKLSLCRDRCCECPSLTLS